MTQTAVAYTTTTDSEQAGRELADQILSGLGGKSPDAVIVFASPRHSYGTLLRALQDGCKAALLVGCSSAGEFMNSERSEGATSALALLSTAMQFSAAVARNLRADSRVAAQQLLKGFRGEQAPGFAHRSALLLTDALAGRTEELIDELTALTGGAYKFFGGGAGDDARFSQTHVFFGTEAVEDAAVALEIVSRNPIGVGVSHGWVPASEPMRVTQADGNRLQSLNLTATAEVFAEYARATGQHFDPADPVPFFLHNVLGIESYGEYKLRVPLTIEPDGTVVCASDIPEGATVCIMKSGETSAAEAAARAARAALDQTHPSTPQVALFFDCVATRLRLGQAFDTELNSLKQSLGQGISYVGCNTYGQIARVDNQFSGFHNCTAVVCAFPGGQDDS